MCRAIADRRVALRHPLNIHREWSHRLFDPISGQDSSRRCGKVRPFSWVPSVPPTGYDLLCKEPISSRINLIVFDPSRACARATQVVALLVFKLDSKLIKLHSLNNHLQKQNQDNIACSYRRIRRNQSKPISDARRI